MLAVLRFRGRAVNRHGDHLRMAAEDELRDAPGEVHPRFMVHDGESGPGLNLRMAARPARAASLHPFASGILNTYEAERVFAGPMPLERGHVRGREVARAVMR